MNDIDRNLETVLRGLREAQPDASLELRITQALGEAQPEAARASWFGSWWLALRVAGVMVACVVVACVVVATILLRSSYHPRTNDVSYTAPLMQQKALPRTTIGVAGERKPQGRGAAARVMPIASAPPQEAHITAQQESFPAPPMPLTEQERLLIRLAHRDDPVQLARLAPGPRDARYRAEKDQVSEFFTPPAPLDQPDMTLTESGGGTQ